MWKQKVWKSPGELIDFTIYDILKSISGKDIFIGCDSKEKNRKAIFACVIIYDRKYYYTKFSYSEFAKYQERLRKEVDIIISLALFAKEINPFINLEVHYDLSQNQKMLSNKILSYASSYAESLNLNWKAKPYAWASTDIADWHTK